MGCLEYALMGHPCVCELVLDESLLAYVLDRVIIRDSRNKFTFSVRKAQNHKDICEDISKYVPSD